MASKTYPGSVLRLAARTAQAVASSPQRWTAYLKTAARIYKYPYHEQVLIYAHQPDAQACASMKFWNERMFRYVDRRTEGIALVDDSGEKLGIKHVFDLKDTRPIRADIPAPYLWQMDAAYEPQVMETLTNAFGKVKNVRLSMQEHIYAIAKIAAKDNLLDYLAEFQNAREGSAYHALDASEAATGFRDAVINSVAYTVMTRCGYDADSFFAANEFRHVLDCNTFETAEILGQATSDISGMMLRAIERCVKGIEGQKVFDRREKFANLAKIEQNIENEPKNQTEEERSSEHGDHIPNRGRLPNSEPDAGGLRGDIRPIREAAQSLPKGAPKGAIRQTDPERRADTAPQRDRPDGAGTGRTDGTGDAKDEPSAREKDRPTRLDSAHKQPQASSGGTDLPRTDLRIKSSQEPEDETPSSGSFPSVPQQVETAQEALTDTVLPLKRTQSVKPFTKEQEPSTLLPVGTSLHIDGRDFTVDHVDYDAGTVSLRDATFASNVGFPVFRSESVDFVLSCMEKPQPALDDPPIVLPQQASDAPNQLDLAALLEQLEVAPHASATQTIPKENEITQPPEQKGVSNAPRTQNYHITDDMLGAGGAKAKYAANIAAITTLKALEHEQREATQEELNALSRYVGWGGIPQVFDERNDKWLEEYAQLKGLLTESEYEAARASTLNAHYTSPTVIRSMYQALANMGFRGGNVLEPAMGVGNFFGMLPEGIANKSRLYGVELDSITGRIAQKLYPEARIQVQGFEKTDFPDDFFDVVVGNVPFGAYKLYDERYSKENLLIHDYFIVKSLDKVRHGGVVAVITSSGTLDKQDSHVRQRIANHAELLGAIRLPNNTFKDNAGTEVTTDILFLQKRDHVIEADAEWIQLGETADGIPVNRYFIKHPDMLLGTMEFSKNMYGSEKDTTCSPLPDVELADQLTRAIQNIHAHIPIVESLEDVAEQDGESLPADPDVRNFSYTLIADTLYFRENSLMNPVETSKTGVSRIRGMIQLRDCARELIDAQINACTDAELTVLQTRLNRLYDGFTHKYGLLNSRGNRSAFQEDASYPLLCALEDIDENGKLKRKTDIFTKRTVADRTPITHAENAIEALAASIAEKACIDLNYMASLLDNSGGVEAIVQELAGQIFKDPTTGDDPYTGWQAADAYLSGNVREKLAAAQHYNEKYSGRFAANVYALQAVQPRPLEFDEIDVRLSATWIPKEYIRQFVFELLETPRERQKNIQALFLPQTGEWSITNKSADRDNINANLTYGTTRVSAYYIIQNALNLRDTRVFDTKSQPDGSEKRVLNEKETIAAQQKQAAICTAFQDWIFSDPDRRATLTALYNEKFNSSIPRRYDGSHIRLAGMNPEQALRPYQKNAVARILYGGNTLLAHCVGAGKTWTIAASVMEGKRIGLCHKSMIVVPNHLTGQWGAEFLQLYPSANILVASAKDFETHNRRRFCARIATGEYDAVILGHSQFGKIPISPARQEGLLNAQISEITDGIAIMKAEKAEHFTIKQMERTRKGLEEKLKRLQNTKTKDRVIHFEELGIDRMYVDESDEFKNLYSFTKMTNVAGIGQSDAQKASDLYNKCLYMDEITDAKGTIFATGTPISNSIVELHTNMRYLQDRMLREHGLLLFDAWASTFAEKVVVNEIAPEGKGYRARTRLARFFNMPELINLWHEVADVQTKEMLNLSVPKANYHTIVSEPTEEQRHMVEQLGERAEAIRSGRVDRQQDNMLKVTFEGRSLALDQRQMDSTLPDAPDSKVNQCIENVFRIWQEGKQEKHTQLIFSDLSTPKPIQMEQQEDGSFAVGDSRFCVYDDIRTKLIARGVPADEITFIHSSNTEAQKIALFSRVREGKVRILLGSTAKCGAGTNVQKRLKALHHCDIPWRPRDLEQREGRIIRYGNNNEEVDIYRYVTKSTFDSYMWQTVEAKQRFIGQIMTGKLPWRTCEDVDDTALSYAEVKALSAGDVRIKEKMDLDIREAQLKTLRAQHRTEQYRLEDMLKNLPLTIKRDEQDIEQYRADEQAIQPPIKKEDAITIDGVVYEEKKKAVDAIHMLAQTVHQEEQREICTYRGFHVHVARATDFLHPYRLILSSDVGKAYSAAFSADTRDLFYRMDQLLEMIPTRLEEAKAALGRHEKALQSASARLGIPFPQEEEYQAVCKRLAELNTELRLNVRTADALDDTPEDEKPVQRQRANVR